MRLQRQVIAVAGLLAGGAMTSAQTTVILPDTSQTTPASATVIEQARVTVPAGVSFAVTNVGAATVSSAAAITVDQIVLTSATRQLRVSVRAQAPSFTPPAAGGATWSAGDVSWNAASWSGAAGAGGTLSTTVYNAVATCNPGTAACSTAGLVFSLAAKPAVQRAGAHTLVVSWKVESLSP